MTPSEMHVMFRQYAQQMGMQNVRAIIPEQIDIFLNDSVADVVKQIINQNIAITDDRILNDTIKLGSINALRNLYNVFTIRFFDSFTVDSEQGYVGRYFSGRTDNGIVTYLDKFEVNTDIDTGFSVYYCKNLANRNIHYSEDNDVRGQIEAYCRDVLSSTNTTDKNKAKYKQLIASLTKKQSDLNDFMFIVDVSLNYSIGSKYTGISDAKTLASKYNSNPNLKSIVENFDWGSNNGGIPSETNITDDVIFELFKCTTGNKIPQDGDLHKVTPFYPVRFIEDRYLSDTLNDYILHPSFRSPVLVKHLQGYELFVGNKNKLNVSNIVSADKTNLVPYNLRISVIGKPEAIKFTDDIVGEAEYHSLPSYLHGDIVKHAVDLYRTALSGTLYAQQQGNNQQSGEQNAPAQ